MNEKTYRKRRTKQLKEMGYDSIEQYNAYIKALREQREKCPELAREYHREYHRKYRKKHSHTPEWRARKWISQNKKRSNRGGADLKYIIDLLKNTTHCTACGRKFIKNPKSYRYITIDHIIPLSQGSDHSPANLRAVCRGCNCYKSNRKRIIINGGRKIIDGKEYYHSY